jgi:hypothetical protein
MTARDDTINAVLATGILTHKTYIAEVIDAIPPGVLARLAIERGAIEDEGAWVDPNDDYRIHNEDERRPPNAYTLYRIAEAES